MLLCSTQCVRKKVNLQFAAGVIRVHSRGFGFLIPDDRVSFPEDIFIPRHSTSGAVDGDRVEVSVNRTCFREGA